MQFTITELNKLGWREYYPSRNYLWAVFATTKTNNRFIYIWFRYYAIIVASLGCLDVPSIFLHFLAELKQATAMVFHLAK